MPTPIPVLIDDPADPRIAVYRGLPDGALRVASGLPEVADDRPAVDESRLRRGPNPAGGLFIAEGELVVRQLLASRFKPRSLLLTPIRHAALAPALSALPAGVPVYVAGQRVMDAIAGFHIHRGVLAAAERGAPLDSSAVIREARLLVVLEDLCNHDNIGGVFRNASALVGRGAAVLLTPRCADPLYRKAVRVSLGHVLRVPFARVEPWPAALDELRRAGWATVALTPHADAEPIDRAAARLAGRRLALLLGTEGAGLTPAAMSAADARVRIPLADGADSLNAAAAAAIALHRFASGTE